MKRCVPTPCIVLILLAQLVLLGRIAAHAQQFDKSEFSRFQSTPLTCAKAGEQCPPWLPCCPGLMCVVGGNRMYCEGVGPPPPPTINTLPSPSDGAIHLPYGFTFTANNGVLPLTWSETGTLAPGLRFAADGLLSGTPSTTGSFPITVEVKDLKGRAATPENFSIQVFLHGFRPTGKMTAVRTSHTATLLDTGRVLVAGGYTSAGGLQTDTSTYASSDTSRSRLQDSRPGWIRCSPFL